MKKNKKVQDEVEKVEQVEKVDGKECECGEECKCEDCECDEGSGEKVKNLEEQVKRALADYANLEKRVLNERQEWIKISNKDLILKFLSVFDTLLLAQVHEKSKTLEVTIAQFLDALEAEGVEKIKTVGEKFDPYTMEVIETREGGEDTVLEETRPGFILYDKILRPAQVIVGKGK